MFSDLQSRCNNALWNSTGNCFQSLGALSSSVAWFSIYTFTQHKRHVRRVDRSLEEQRFQGFKKHKDREGVGRSGVREKGRIQSTRAVCVCQGKHPSPAQGWNLRTGFTMLPSPKSHKSLSYYFLTLTRGRKPTKVTVCFSHSTALERAQSDHQENKMTQNEWAQVCSVMPTHFTGFTWIGLVGRKASAKILCFCFLWVSNLHQCPWKWEALTDISLKSAYLSHRGSFHTQPTIFFQGLSLFFSATAGRLTQLKIHQVEN